jgi:predicted DNA-binding transcriptional regulator AlpA
MSVVIDRPVGRNTESRLPTFLRFPDLKRMGIVRNWTTLQRWIDSGDFPPGIKLGPNSRAWTDTSIEEWLDSRPNGGE